MRRKLFKLIFLSLLLSLLPLLFPRLGVNLTGSVKPKLFILTSSPLLKNSYAALEMLPSDHRKNSPFSELLKGKRLVKRVFCIPGEVMVCFYDRCRCGELFTPPLPGDKLSLLTPVQGEVPDGFMGFTGDSVRSYDSRYYFVLPSGRVKCRLEPLLSF